MSNPEDLHGCFGRAIAIILIFGLLGMVATLVGLGIGLLAIAEVIK